MMLLGTQRRHMLAEYPEGDPFGGAAYGEKNKSSGLSMAIGVVSGVMTGGAGWGMMAANMGSSAAGATLGMLSGGAMFAGGIATTLGAVTGNKRLSKIGGTLSLAGGVGSLGADIAAAGGIADAKWGGTLAEGASKTMSQLSEAFSSVTGTASQTGTSAASQTLSVGSDLAGGQGLAAGGGQGLTSSGSFGPTFASEGVASAGGTGTGLLGAGAQQAAAPVSTATITPVGTAARTGAQQAAGQSRGIIGGAMDFLKSSPGQNLMGKVLEGAAAGDAAQDELDFLKEQYGDNQAELERRLANLNYRFEVIDPNDPQAAQKRATAKANGIPTLDLGVNPNAGPVTPQGVSMQPNTMGA